MKYTSVESILKNWTPGYVPPVSWEALARTAQRQGLQPQSGWPPPMQEAWTVQEIRNAANAETSAWLVSQGMGGEL